MICLVLLLFGKLIVLQPLDIGSFMLRFSSQELVLIHAQYLPFVLEGLINLQHEAAAQIVCIDWCDFSCCCANPSLKSLMEQLLSGGFCVPTQILQEAGSSGHYFVLSLLRAITVHVANLLFMHHTALNPLLMHCVNVTMDLTFQLDRHTTQPGEKQKIDTLFGRTAHLDIALLIAALISSNNDRSDESTKTLIQQIEVHFSWLAAQQLWLDACQVTYTGLNQIRNAHRLVELATTPIPQHVGCTLAPSQLNLLQWLVNNVSVLSDRISRGRAGISRLALKVL